MSDELATMKLINALIKWFFGEQYRRCLDDTTRQCTYGYTFSRNGALHIYGNLHECCRVKRQIKAAAQLAGNLMPLPDPPKDGE